MMNRKNSMGIMSFVLFHILWAIIAMMILNNIFRCVSPLSLIESKYILCGCIIISSLVGGIFEIKHRRNAFSIILNLITGFGSYFVFSYIQIYRELITITLIVSAVASIIMILLIMCRRIVNQRKKKRIIRRRIEKAYFITQTLFCFGLVFILCVLEFNKLFGFSIMTAKIKPAAFINPEEQTIENNMDTFALLKEEKWRELSMQEKLNVLQVIADIEEDYLGLPNELSVTTADTQGGTLGYYADDMHQIVIRTDTIQEEKPYMLLNVVLHEAYHSYEYRCTDTWKESDSKYQSLMLYNKAKVYEEEYENYNRGEEDYFAYYMQQCEIDSREYAQSRAQDYCDAINEYFGEVIISDLPEDERLYTIKYDDDVYAYLYNQIGECIAGPYLHIENEIRYKWDEACRYTGLNGLIGYLDTEGNEITPPAFTMASQMNNGLALVSEKEGSVYFIDSKGNRISKDYLDAHPFEHQGFHARVQTEDGKWGIINREDELIFSGADYIEELPSTGVVGAAVVDGHVVLFELDTMDEEYREIEEFEQFVGISEICYGKYVIVKNESGRFGVVDWKGEQIIPDRYLSIEFDVILYEQSELFFIVQLQEDDGTYVLDSIRDVSFVTRSVPLSRGVSLCHA